MPGNSQRSRKGGGGIRTRYSSRVHHQYKIDEDYAKSILLKVAWQSNYKPEVPWKWHIQDSGQPMLKYAGKPGRLTSHMLKSMAQHIATFDGPVRVPPRFFRLLSRAIEKRRANGVLLQALNDHYDASSNATRESDRRHENFMEVLLDLYDTLSPRMANETRSEDDGHRLSFDIPRNSQVDEEWRIESADESADESENFFRLSCFMDDLREIRQVVISAWTAFRENKLDLIAVSLVTNLAIEQAQTYEEEDKEVFSRYGRSTDLLDRLYTAHCLTRNEDPNKHERPGDDLNFATYDIAEAHFIPVQCILEAFLQVNKSGHLPLYKPGFYGVYDPLADRASMSPREKFQEDKILLCEILPHFHILALGESIDCVEDDFTRGLASMFATRVIPLWLLFAGQLFLDIHHLLRQDVMRAYTQLKAISQTITNSIDVVLSSNDKEWPDGHTTKQDNPFLEIRRLSQSAMIDRIREYLEKNVKDRHLLSSVQTHHLWKQHPLMCGLTAFALTAKYLSASLTFSNGRGAILSCLHLYEATKSAGMVQDTWKDMELLLKMHSVDQHILPEARKFGYFGLLVSTLRLNEDQPWQQGPQQTPSTIRLFPGCVAQFPPLAWYFFSRHCGVPSSTNAQMPNAVQAPTEGGIEPNFCHSTLDSPLLSRLSQSLQLSIRSLHRDGVGWDLCNLLNSLQDEVVRFSFDYLWLDKQCWTLLKLIRLKAAHLLEENFGQQYVEKESQLPYICGYILQVIDESKSRQAGAAYRLQRTSRAGSREEILRIVSHLIGHITSHKLPASNLTMGSTVSERLSQIHIIC